MSFDANTHRESSLRNWEEAASGWTRRQDLLRELGVGDADSFIDAEHEVWRPAHEALGSAQALWM